ncbi:alpha/beta hydrolase [Pseudonocardia sp.]|uniref:esterase/lipase family protein n=1 Tax=Pseudonocardia sp. TaxID=60912 RepID=UPI0026398BEA|nr:alpha/beta hydrolase [Pseudonocardia sp.]
MIRRRWVPLLAAVLGLVTATGGASPSGPEPVRGGTCMLGGGVQSAAVEPGLVPVLFVHGMNSDPTMWDEPITGTDRSLEQTVVEDVEGVQTFRFDYRAVALEWVDAEGSGPALAGTLACLARAADRKAVVVAHSLGGLATQFALGRTPVAADGTHPHVAAAITLGTPFTGSQLLAYFQDIREAGAELDAVDGNDAQTQAFDAALTTCAELGLADLRAGRRNRCDVIAVADGPLGTALQPSSDEIGRLPSWPDGVALLPLAGEIETGAALFDPRPPDLPDLIGPGALFRLPTLIRTVEGGVGVGDLAVGLDSARAPDPAVSPLRCRALDAPDDAFLLDCFHRNLQRNPVLAGSVLRTVQAAVQSQLPDPVETVDWTDRSYPMTCSGVSDGPFTAVVAGGSGTGPGDGTHDEYIVEVLAVAVDDLTGDGRSEAVVSLLCAPRNVSPNYFTVELHVHGPGPELLATLVAPPGPGPSEFGIEPRLTGLPSVEDGVITHDVDYWVGADPRAGSSVTLARSWRWNGTTFEVVS